MIQHRNFESTRSRKFWIHTEDLEVIIYSVGITDIQNILPYLLLLFNNLFDSIMKVEKPGSYVQIVFENAGLREPIMIKTINNSMLTADIFSNNLTKILQSYQEFSLRERTTLRFTWFRKLRKGGVKYSEEGILQLLNFYITKKRCPKLLTMAFILLDVWWWLSLLLITYQKHTASCETN